MAVRSATRLWAILFRDTLKERRRNILTQVYPQYTNLLDNTKIWSGGDDLFGQKFEDHLVATATARAKLDKIEGKKKATTRPSSTTEGRAVYSNFRNRGGDVGR